MQPEILEERKLVDDLTNIVRRLGQLNKLITDPQFKSSILIVVGQHRHTFEEQGVTDHSNCVTILSVVGDVIDIEGLLIFGCMHDKTMREATHAVGKVV